ncbi:MAG: RCC1 domain-containing protein [Gordonia sp. (in: high G+C Gram-positive bacteria)]
MILLVGIGTTIYVLTRPDVTAITSGGGTTCAIADGHPYCWGNNEYGQLCDGTTTNRTTPTRVTGL